MNRKDFLGAAARREDKEFFGSLPPSPRLPPSLKLRRTSRRTSRSKRTGRSQIDSEIGPCTSQCVLLREAALRFEAQVALLPPSRQSRFGGQVGRDDVRLFEMKEFGIRGDQDWFVVVLVRW